MVEYGSGRWGPDQPTERAWKPSSRPQDAILVGLIRMMESSNPSMMALPPIPSRAWKMTTAGRHKVWQGQRSHHGESVTTRGSAKPEGRDAASPLSPGARQARPLPRPAVGAKVSFHRPFVLESWRGPPPDRRSPRLPTPFACASSAASTLHRTPGRSGVSSSSPATSRSATWARRSRSPSASTTRICGRSSSAASRGTTRPSTPFRRRRTPSAAGGLGQLTGCASVTPPPARNSCSCSTTAMSGTSASGWSAPARRLSPTPSIRGWWPAVARPPPVPAGRGGVGRAGRGRRGVPGPVGAGRGRGRRGPAAGAACPDAGAAASRRAAAGLASTCGPPSAGTTRPSRRSGGPPGWILRCRPMTLSCGWLRLVR
jgi:hypothetical protein